MTAAEFDAWLKDYCTAFPECSVWIDSLKKPFDTLGKWREVFEAKRITLAVGREVTMAMMSGEAPAVANYDRDNTAARVVAAAREIRMQRGDAYRSEAEIAAMPKRTTAKYTRPEGAISAWQMAEQYRLMRSQGTSKAECDRWLDAEDRKAYPQ